MKMTNGEAAFRLNALKQMENMDMAIPVAAGYRIMQNLKSLSTALEPYQTMRDAIIRKYSNGKLTIKKEDDPEAFQFCVKELEELDALELDVDIQKMPVSLIGKKELPFRILYAMEFMIEGGGDG